MSGAEECDRAVCDCGDCENRREAAASHRPAQLSDWWPTEESAVWTEGRARCVLTVKQAGAGAGWAWEAWLLGSQVGRDGQIGAPGHAVAHGVAETRAGARAAAVAAAVRAVSP